MSERTAPALAELDALIPRLEALAPSPARDQMLDEAAALRRAVASFHMEAIRFRMYPLNATSGPSNPIPKCARFSNA